MRKFKHSEITPEKILQLSRNDLKNCGFSRQKIEYIQGLANNFIKQTYTDDMIPALWKKWLDNYERMKVAHSNNVWNAHPSGLCKRHCVVLECIHNGSN